VVVIEGLTIMVKPFPSIVPPQLPLYHNQSAFVPRLPPDTDKVVVEPLQIVPITALADKGGLESEFKEMEILKQVVVLQSPTAFRK